MISLQEKSQAQIVGAGVAVVVTRAARVLVGKRPGTGADFEWQLPGGWIEPGESPMAAARREVYEETGLRIVAPEFIGVTNNVFSASSHSISLYFEAECDDGDAVWAAEGGNSPVWEWRDWAQITENLFLPLRLLKQTDYQPFLPDKRRTYVSF